MTRISSIDIFSNFTGVYCFGFNGKESDSEGMGGGLSTYDYGFRIYNPSLGKFLSVDPLCSKYPQLTCFQFASNSPEWAIDFDGLEARIAIYGEGSDVKTFQTRALDCKKKCDLTKTIGVSTGSNFLKTLKLCTSEFGSIQAVACYSHGWNQGLIFNPGSGFYISNSEYGDVNRSDIQDLETEIAAGNVKFEEDAVVVFVSCNLAKAHGNTSFAEDFTARTGVTTIAADGQVGPQNRNKKPTGNAISKSWYKFQNIDGEIKRTYLGKTISPADIINDIKPIKSKNAVLLEIENE
jgi:RHS repeat-associated protein